MLQKNCCWKELSICFSSELQHSPDTKAIGEWNFQLLKWRRWTLKALIDIWDFKLRCSCSQTSCLAPAAPHTTMRGSTAWPPELTAEYFKINNHSFHLPWVQLMQTTAALELLRHPCSKDGEQGTCVVPWDSESLQTELNSSWVCLHRWNLHWFYWPKPNKITQALP